MTVRHFGRDLDYRRVASVVEREHGAAAVDELIRALNLDQVFGLKPGTRFSRP